VTRPSWQMVAVSSGSPLAGICVLLRTVPVAQRCASCSAGQRGVFGSLPGKPTAASPLLASLHWPPYTSLHVLLRSSFSALGLEQNSLHGSCVTCESPTSEPQFTCL
jgi:hypothetical protein